MLVDGVVGKQTWDELGSKSRSQSSSMCEGLPEIGSQEMGTTVTPTTIMYNFFKGIVEAGKENIDGIWNFIKNPIKSAIEMAQGIAFLKRAATAGTEENIAFMSGIAREIANFAIGDGNEKARIIGKIAGEILITVLATKGMSALKNIIQDSAKAGNLAELIEIGKNRKIGSAEVGSIFERVGNAVGKSTEITNLLDNMPELTGSTRDKLLSITQNSKLRNIVDQLYRPGATVGDGGTASMLEEEFSQGSSKHLQKAQERLTQLNNLAKSEKLSLNDSDILDALRNDLNDAINLFK
ncbi:hypothetical protein bsdE14_23780 [Clostridium omnivorum]|uniref:Uncharacterized protein n=1 Tax=Clostridium omnivorum TaxID=1604902 RepID=A0ABQ5N6X6_9CLOT|nr:hypothetical protein bsdE14_23780 [Clostridium sp. E14]